MAIIILGNTNCSICNKVLEENQEMVSWTAFLPKDHKLYEYSDSGMHKECFNTWSHKKEFQRLNYYQPLVDFNDPNIEKLINKNGMPDWLEKVKQYRDNNKLVVIIDYGAGNIKSIQFAFKRLGVDAVLSNNAEEIKNADKVIFPGVGEASSAMQKLKESGLDKLIPTLKQPVLGICLGMQLLCNSSEEGNTKGLGVFNVNIKRFSKQVKVPQMGWNTISNLKSNLFKGIDNNAFMYLVHSYYAENNSEAIATTNYEFEYASALQKDNFYGVQFHPEKSSVAGEQILKNFLEI